MKALKLVLSVSLISACFVTQASTESTSEVVLRSEVAFQPLNPLRGDKSPKAGMLWGDIRSDVPSGFLVKFADGFESPPHNHNITYRAVVIDDLAHNDDPTAEKMWMAPGSFWTQPAGENHVTAAIGSNATVLLDILEGPYLVKPPAESFDNGERPVNIEARNIVWQDRSNSTWVLADGPQISFLWGNPQNGKKYGSFIKLQSGFHGVIRTESSLFRAVTIQGDVSAKVSGRTGIVNLAPGSYFGSKGEAEHTVSCKSKDECLIYVHAEGKYIVSPAP